MLMFKRKRKNVDPKEMHPLLLMRMMKKTLMEISQTRGPLMATKNQERMMICQGLMVSHHHHI